MNLTGVPMVENPAFERLFDPDFLARLQQFSLRLTRAQKGGRLAEQTTAARGQGADFADFKPYVAGDDLRAIDWNIYRRLGRVFVRVFEERQDMPVHFLVDVSRSMFLESPPRIDAALRTTLALAAIALGQHDSVGLFPFSGEMTVQARSISGRNNVIRVARHLSEYAPLGNTDLVSAVARLASLKLRRGLVVIVSDFFDDAGIEAVVAGMRRLPHKVLLVQMTRILDAEPERDPALHGDLAIENGESPARIEVRVTPELVERYKRGYRAFNETLRAFARERGSGLLRMDADGDVLEQLSALFDGGELVL
ncbi:DUF58 domain-containing protein [Luteimonas sp. XNQY3]|nr:DUF58 domain-containing protein [Luteimonas sp. XNQY3]MCD9005878.1 DUF58 domain-containing protein [Luteimonas sp. XNQY3]